MPLLCASQGDTLGWFHNWLNRTTSATFPTGAFRALLFDEAAIFFLQLSLLTFCWYTFAFSFMEGFFFNRSVQLFRLMLACLFISFATNSILATCLNWLAILPIYDRPPSKEVLSPLKSLRSVSPLKIRGVLPPSSPPSWGAKQAALVGFRI